MEVRVIFGVDVSNYQSHFDFDAASAEGYDFAFVKATQGDWFVDARYRQHLAGADAAGLLVAAYHYQSTDPFRTQADHIGGVVDPSVPLIIDVEDGSGGVDITRDLVDILRDRGYRVVLSYIPRWYWSRIGSPDLSGLPPLWVSRYPDYTTRRKEDALYAALALTGGDLFTGHGGLPASVAQVTSTGAVADYPNGNIDLNVFAGDRRDLAALLGEHHAPPSGGAAAPPKRKGQPVLQGIVCEAASEGYPEIPEGFAIVVNTTLGTQQYNGNPEWVRQFRTCACPASR
jgi:lysozyme